jgi:hypothetical protein
LALLVIILGLLLAGGGAAFLLLGFDIVMTERGSAMTIGGTIALSGGVVTLGLGLALLRLTQILRALEARDAPIGDAKPDAQPAPAAASGGLLAAGAGAAVGVAGVAAVAAHAADDAEAVDIPRLPLHLPPEVDGLAAHERDDHAASMADEAADAPFDQEVDDLASPGRAPETAHEEAFETGETDAGGATVGADRTEIEFLLQPAPVDDASLAEPARDEVAADDRQLDDVEPGDPPHDDPPPDDLPSDDDAREQRLNATLEDGPSFAPLPLAPPVRALLGSYRAGGRTYTMFSDGSVEAAIGDSVERFESMEALRLHLART